jgi:preprotein translocase subunit SecG
MDGLPQPLSQDRKPQMISVVIAIHLMLVLALIGVVLLQKSEGGGLVSSSSGFLSSRGQANVLTRATAFLAAGFFVTSLILSLLAGHSRGPTSILGSQPGQQTPGSLPVQPLNQGTGGLLNQLGGNPSAPAPSAPGPSAPAPAPSGPQVPQSH